jgi:non-hemolytic enterotoxin A
MKKKLVACFMVLAIILTTLIPQNTLAETNKELRSITFSNWIRTLGSQYPLLQSYGLVILKQPTLDIKDMSSLTNHQQIARTNVREWLDEYSPQLIYLNENMNGLSQRVNQYYNRLYELAGEMNTNEQAKTDFLNRFNRLQGNLEDMQADLKRTSLDLNAYNDLLDSDSKAFSEKATKAVELLNGQNGGEATQLRETIKALLAEIQDELIKIITNPDEVYDFSFRFGQLLYNTVKTSTETQTVDVASIEAISKEIANATNFKTKRSATTIQQKQQEVAALMKKLSKFEQQATEITIVEDQIIGFAEMVKREITIFDHIVNEFTTLKNTMDKLKDDVLSGEVNPSELQSQLKHLKEIMLHINKQTEQFEGFTTSIK